MSEAVKVAPPRAPEVFVAVVESGGSRREFAYLSRPRALAAVRKHQQDGARVTLFVTTLGGVWVSTEQRWDKLRARARNYRVTVFRDESGVPVSALAGRGGNHGEDVLFCHDGRWSCGCRRVGMCEHILATLHAVRGDDDDC